MMKLADFLKKRKGATAIEITVVVIILFVMFIVVIDMSMYFRQPYLLQNFNDELLAKIQLAHNCHNSDGPNSEIISELIKKVYNKEIYADDITGRALNGVEEEINADSDFSETDYAKFPMEKKVFEYTAGDFKIILTCKNPQVPNSVLTEYTYNGIFLYKHKRLVSNPSTNTTESYY